MGLFSHQESYLGVDIGANGIKLVELHKNKGRPQLWTYGILDEPLDVHMPELHDKTPEELVGETKGFFHKKEKKEFFTDIDDPRVDKYAKLLKELIVAAKVTTTHTTASLPVSYVFHEVLNLPRVDEKEIDHIVKAEVKKMLSRPIEEMQVVYQIVPEPDLEKKKRFTRVLVTAAPRELVMFYTLIFQKAGLQLQELETEAFALERSLVGKDTSIVMVVDMGAERTNFFIIDQGLPLTHRTISIGGDFVDKILINNLGISSTQVEQVKKDLSKSKEKIDITPFLPIIDPIEKEIEYGFDLFTHQTGNEGKKPEKIILTGGSSVLPFIAEYIQSKFNLKVFVGDPWARVVYHDGLKMVLDDIGPRLSVGIGLALRNML